MSALLQVSGCRPTDPNPHGSPAEPAVRVAAGAGPAAHPASRGPRRARRTVVAPTSPALHGGPAGTPRSRQSPAPQAAPGAAAARPVPAPEVQGLARPRPATPGRRYPTDLVLVQQAPQGGGRGAKLVLYPRQGPRVGDQPVYQIGPRVLEAQLGQAVGDALVGGVLALAGELLAAGWLVDLKVGDGAADGRLGRGEVAGEPGDAPAVVQQGVQAGAQVGEAQASGPAGRGGAAGCR
jgi:hypothetical protein